jgi:hypothetical protein
MKHIKTALLAGALAFTATVALAQVNIGGSANTRGGASAGTPGGVNSSTQLNTGAGANVGRDGVNTGIDAGANSQLDTHRNQTTGSGDANGSMKLDTK